MATQFNRNPSITERRIKYYKYSAVLLAGIILALFVTEVTGLTHFINKKAVPPVIPVTSNPTPTPSPQNQTDQAQKSDKDSTSGNSPGSSSQQTNLPLYTPYGDFISNHHPGQNGAPTSESSVCNTTACAKCYIRFTQGSTVTSLPAKTTDSKGTAYWQWDVKSAELSSGNWTVTAVATLNGQTKTAQDPLALVISQ